MNVWALSIYTNLLIKQSEPTWAGAKAFEAVIKEEILKYGGDPADGFRRVYAALCSKEVYYGRNVAA